jgi:methionyl-tRNA formyltransferase
MMNATRLLFLGKRDDAHCERALSHCRRVFPQVDAHVGQWNDPLPEEVRSWTGDYIFSYLSRWIVPEALLRKARLAAINFHAAPPEYPGFGPINFALYEGVATYGVTCHHMASRVDTGNIIATKRFALLPTDDVESLLSRTYDFQLVLFYEVVERLRNGEQLAPNGERWSRAPLTRKQFEELNRLDVSMTKDEMLRRIRATTFRNYKPQLVIDGIVFEPR